MFESDYFPPKDIDIEALKKRAQPKLTEFQIGLLFCVAWVFCFLLGGYIYDHLPATMTPGLRWLVILSGTAYWSGVLFFLPWWMRSAFNRRHTRVVDNVLGMLATDHVRHMELVNSDTNAVMRLRNATLYDGHLNAEAAKSAIELNGQMPDLTEIVNIAWLQYRDRVRKALNS